MLNKKTTIFLLVISLFVLCIRLYHLSFFEFKFDQFYSINIGNETRAKHFLITHGPATGIGINMPLFFPYVMGLMTTFTQDPFWITFIYLLLNLLGLSISVYYFYKRLPRQYAFLSTILIAFSPAFTMYSNIIWPQCVLLPLVGFFFIALDEFIRKRQGKHFIFICIIASVSAQLHFSGLFLFPAVFLIGFLYRKEIKPRFLIFAFVAAVFLFLPYLYHLIFEKELAKFISYSNLSSRHIYWKIFRQHIRLASFDFLRYYFRYDFNQVLTKAMGNLWFVFYIFSCVLIFFFITGVTMYFNWLIKRRMLFNLKDSDSLKYPLPFQIAGFVFVLTTLSYLVLRVDTPPHYLMILFPAYGILTAYPVYRLWDKRLVRFLFYLGFSSTLILLIGVLLFLSSSGGHPHEYGFSYRSIMKLKNEVKKIIPAGYYAKLNISFASAGKTDIEPLYYLLSDLTREEGEPIPLNIVIDYNKSLLRYEYTINKS